MSTVESHFQKILVHDRASRAFWTFTIGTYTAPQLQQAGFGADPACAASSNPLAPRSEPCYYFSLHSVAAKPPTGCFAKLGWPALVPLKNVLNARACTARRHDLNCTLFCVSSRCLSSGWGWSVVDLMARAAFETAVFRTHPQTWMLPL